MNNQIIAVFAASLWFSTALSELAPTTILAPVGGEVELPCPAPGNGTVSWQFECIQCNFADELSKDVYVYGIFFNGMRSRATLVGAGRNSFNNLLIRNVKLTDGGLYVCTEDSGIGRTRYVLLRIQYGPNDLVKVNTTASIATTGQASSAEPCRQLNNEIVVSSEMAYQVVIGLLLTVVAISWFGFIVFFYYTRRRRARRNHEWLVQHDIEQSNVRSDYGKCSPFRKSDDCQDEDRPHFVSMMTKSPKARNLVMLKLTSSLFAHLKVTSSEADREVLRTVAYVDKVTECGSRTPLIKRKLLQIMDYHSRPCKRRLKVSNTLLPPDNEVCCYTKFLGDIYVIRGRSMKLLVFRSVDDMKYELKETFCLSVEIDPLGFTPNHASTSLFLSDRRNRCVWKISPPHHSEDPLTRWYDLSVKRELPVSLAFSQENDYLMILVVFEENAVKESRGRLECRTQDNRLMSAFQLHHDMKFPTCISCTNRRTCAVSWAGGVSEVDNTGREVRRCTREMSLPVHMMSVYDKLFVADVKNGNILLLNDKLEVHKIVLELSTTDEKCGLKDGVGRDIAPMRVYIDVERRELIVGLRNGQIDIYMLEYCQK